MPHSRLTTDELRFLIFFGIQQLPKSLAKEMAGTDRVTRERANKRAAELLLARFDEHEVLAPKPARGPLFG